MIQQYLQYAYWTLLGALMLCIMSRGSAPMKRTILTLAAVLAVSFVLTEALVWPSEEWALVMMGIDAIAATVILFHPAGKAQSAIGLTFLLQIGVHAGRVLNGSQADLNLYWWGLSILAFLQLAIIGGWWVHERLSRRGAVHRGGAAPDPAYRKGVAR
jgi:hypothetical protein